MNKTFETPNDNQDRTPFYTRPETIAQEENFDILKLGRPKTSQETPEGIINEFEQTPFAITEYFLEKGQYLDAAKDLKSFYESVKSQMGDIVPDCYFVIGQPSDNSRQGVSLYVIQNLEKFHPQEGVKTLGELNTKEYSTELMNGLLELQDKIREFLEQNGIDGIDDDFIDPRALDEHIFPEEVVYSPDNKNLSLTGLFNIDPKLIKKIIGSDAKFTGDPEQLKVLKLIGLGKIAEKIEWFLNRSALREFLKGPNIHASLNKEKMAQFEAEGRKVMALTFDDGPNEQTEELLDILKEAGVKATFFLTGMMIPGREHIVERMIAEGHEVGVHEWGHHSGDRSLIYKDPKEYIGGRFLGPREDLGDIKKTALLIEKITGQKPNLGRVAGVHGTIESFREFELMGLDLIHAAASDVLFMMPTKKLKAEELLKRALGETPGTKLIKGGNGHGRIRLFHIGCMTDDNAPMDPKTVDRTKGEVYPPEETVKMIREFIETSQKQGYEFVGLKENL